MIWYIYKVWYDIFLQYSTNKPTQSVPNSLPGNIYKGTIWYMMYDYIYLYYKYTGKSLEYILGL